MAWEGEQLADMPTTVSISASYPHVFAHKHISLPPLSGFYCANSRTTETPNGPTLLTPPQPRLLRDCYSYPIQYLDLAVFANLCQLLVYETPVVHRPHYSGCTPDRLCIGLPPTFSLYDSLPHVTSSRKHRGTSYPQRMQSVLFGFSPRLFNHLSRRS